LWSQITTATITATTTAALKRRNSSALCHLPFDSNNKSQKAFNRYENDSSQNNGSNNGKTGVKLKPLRPLSQTCPNQ